MTDTSLENIVGWSAEQTARLKESWITTAEQVVALAATTSGIEALAAQLGISKAEVNRLVTATRDALTPTRREEMEQTVDTSEYGLGAKRPGKGE